MARVLLSVPATARAGEILEIRALIQHPMETGFRPGMNGEILPRDIITHFSCRYNGEEVFSAELSPAIAANPFIAFSTVATTSGNLAFTWTGDGGFAQTEIRVLTVR